MSANQKIILAIFIVYLALNAAIGIIFSNRQNKKQHTSSEKKFFIGGRTTEAGLARIKARTLFGI